jgi:hypothetical protein
MAAAPSSSKPVLVVLSILVGLNVINGGLLTLEVMPAKVVGLLALGTAAVSAAVGFYLQGVVVPVDAVAARVTGDGKIVTGDADPTIRPGTEVEVSPVGPSPYSDPHGSH